MEIKAVFRGTWEEGTTQTDCLLNLETGHISLLEEVDLSDNLKNLICATVTIWAGKEISIDVKLDGGYAAVLLSDVTDLKDDVKFQILTVMQGENENTQSYDDVPAYFASFKEASDEIINFVKESKVEYEAGNLAAPYSIEDYLIQNVNDGATFSLYAGGLSNPELSQGRSAKPAEFILQPSSQKTNVGDDLQQAASAFKSRAKQLNINISNIKPSQLLELIASAMAPINKQAVASEPASSETNELLNDVADVMEAYLVHGDVSKEQFEHWIAKCRGQAGNTPDSSFPSI